MDQSESIRTSRMTLFRSRPRKPGHSAATSVARARGSVFAVAGATEASAAGAAGLLGMAATVSADVGGRGSSLVCARSRSSAVGIHRHFSCEAASPVTPSVRTSVNTPQARTMDTTIGTHCRVAARQPAAAPTSARPSTGAMYAGMTKPIPAAMDG